jgi:diguanylate cyclase (GGDEF)-like protein
VGLRCILDSMSNKSRSKQEIVLLMLSFGAAAAISPFIFFRIGSQDWTNVVFDSILLSVFLSMGVYIFKTREVKLPRIVLATLSILALFIGLYLNGASRIPWAYPSLVAVFFAVRPSLAAKLCIVSIFLSSVILFPKLTTFQLLSYLVTITTTSVFVYVFAKTTRDQRERLIQLSRRDPLTGQRNRRAFDEMLDEIVGEPRGISVNSLIILDIDNFKKVNDNFGHAAGDQVLIAIGELANKRLRKQDRFYRIGGEEFAILLKGGNLKTAQRVAEEMRLLVASELMVEQQNMTVSLGVAQYLSSETKEAWVARADKALYLAKSKGRNQTQSLD